MLVSLSSSEAPAIAKVGGKAASLIRLMQAGFPVPNGSVLTSEFFEPWIAAIQVTPEWDGVLDLVAADIAEKEHGHLAEACTRVRHVAASLPLHR